MSFRFTINMPEGSNGNIDNSPHPTLPSSEIHEVTQNEIVERAKKELDGDFMELGRTKFSRRFDHEAIDTQRRDIMQKVGGIGEDAARDLFPYLHEKYSDEAQHSPDKTSYYDLTLVNDALVTDSPEDIQRSLDILDEIRKSSLPSGGMNNLLFAREQICYTLTRQISELQEKNPQAPQLEEIRQKLLDVRNDPFTEDLMRDKLLRIPLAVVQDPRAIEELGTIKDIEVGKYDRRQFDLDKLDFIYKERVNAHQESDTTEAQTVDPVDEEALQVVQDAKIEEVRDELREIVSEDEDITDDERRRREILERLRTPQSINSYDSAYPSHLQYEIPDPDALWHYLKSGDHKRNNYEYFQDYGESYPMGPGIGKDQKHPVIYFDEARNAIELRLPVPTERGKDLANVFVPNFIPELKRTMGDRIDASIFNVSTDRGAANDLQRKIPGRNGAYGIAHISNGELTINVSNLTKNYEGGIRSVEDFRVAMQNALDLHRIFTTEYYNEENVTRNRQGKELVDVPYETIVIDHRADLFDTTQVPQAA